MHAHVYNNMRTCSLCMNAMFTFRHFIFRRRSLKKCIGQQSTSSISSLLRLYFYVLGLLLSFLSYACLPFRRSVSFFHLFILLSWKAIQFYRLLIGID